MYIVLVRGKGAARWRPRPAALPAFQGAVAEAMPLEHALAEPPPAALVGLAAL
jgi:hypothetical protein